jgi:hypothetical protein
MGGYDHMHLHVEIALAATVDARQALAAQPKNCARLCTFGNPQLLLTLQGRDFDLRTRLNLDERAVKLQEAQVALPGGALAEAGLAPGLRQQITVRVAELVARSGGTGRGSVRQARARLALDAASVPGSRGSPVLRKIP